MEDDFLEIAILDTSSDIGGLKDTYKKAADVLAYLLHQESVEPSRKATFMVVVHDGRLPMVNMTKEFAYHLINNMEEPERERLKGILKEDISEFGIENETLTDFVEMELLDTVNTYRKWEYGKYAIENFINSFDKYELHREWETKDLDHKILLEIFASNLDRDQEKWDPQTKVFLVQALKYRLDPNFSNIASYGLVGDLVKQNLVYLSIEMNRLKSAFKESLSQAVDRGRRRGPKR
ncbi:MAG: hypothetical protein AAFQ20_07065 [Bacteroidota bacterium]